MPTIPDLVAAHPDLRQVMKRYQPGFTPCLVAIVTRPDVLPGWCVYGDFVVDHAAVRRRAASGQVKQDFLLYEETTGQVVYYSGTVSDSHPGLGGRHINELAARLRGTQHYGVDSHGRRIGDHHYSGDDDPHLPTEEETRRRISITLARVKTDLGVD